MSEYKKKYIRIKLNENVNTDIRLRWNNIKRIFNGITKKGKDDTVKLINSIKKYCNLQENKELYYNIKERCLGNVDDKVIYLPFQTCDYDSEEYYDYNNEVDERFLNNKNEIYLLFKNVNLNWDDEEILDIKKSIHKFIIKKFDILDSNIDLQSVIHIDEVFTESNFDNYIYDFSESDLLSDDVDIYEDGCL